MVDGYLKIKTKLDNKDIDKGVTELENKIKKLQTDNSNLSNEQRTLQEEINSYDRLTKEAEKYRHELENIEKEKNKISGSLSMLQSKETNPDKKIQVSKSGMLTAIDTRTGLNENQTKQNLAQIEQQLVIVKQRYNEATKELDKQAPKLENVYTKLEKIKNKQTENNSKMDLYKQKIDQINVNKAQKGIENVGKSIQNQIGKISKLAMAVVGIRTAFGAVRSAIGMVSQYNKQVSTDFEYMRFCIANLIAPAVQWLVRLLYTALSYINAIMTAWFGINIFSNSTAKNFQKMQSSASGTAKAAKEINKSLQGFDEANILQDSSSDSSGSGGGAGASVPSMDLSGMQAEVPAWLKWIINNKDLILSIIAGIAAGLIAIKSGLGAIESLGIGVLVGGLVYSIQALKDYLDDPTFTNLGKFIQGIGVAIIGLAITVGNLPLAVVGAIVLIWGTIVKYWEQIKEFLQGGIDWFEEKSDWIRETFGDTIGDIYDTAVSGLQSILDWFDKTFNRIKANFDEIIAFIKNIFAGNWKSAWENIKNIFKNTCNNIKDTFMLVVDILSKVASNVAKAVGGVISSVFKAVVNAVLRTIENVLNSPIRAINGLIGTINLIPGVNLRQLSTFNLPRLAKGSVLNKPTPVIAGEAGAEAIIPLENNTEGLELIADKIASKIGASGGSYIIQLDGRTILRGMAKKQQELAFAKNGR